MSGSPDEQKNSNRLFHDPQFVLSVASLEQLPEADRPEVAFAGRSNVGKSSLLNALTCRRDLARTSNTPGRTQQLNFFNLADTIYLVDMPGYGYAKVPQKQRKDWTKLVKAYLKGRPNLRIAFVLIDARHGLKENDLEIMTMLDQAGVAYRTVFTKADKVKREHLESVLESARAELKKHPAAFPDILVTSSEKSIGITELQDCIAALAV